VTDSATFSTPEADDEETGEDLGGLDDLLASLRSDDEPAPKRGRGKAKKEAAAKDFKAVLWASADKLRAQMDAGGIQASGARSDFPQIHLRHLCAQQGKVLLMVERPCL
jgi:hypothetical protein